VLYYFEEVDLKECKKTLGDIAAIKGSFPIQTLMFGTPEQIKDKVKETLDIMAPGGGYLFSTGCSVDRAPRENMEAMFETVREYGKY
jgi:uroporphyrinogen-III decarboxylase